MKAWYSFFAVAALIILAFLVIAAGWQFLLGVVIPYAAIATFVIGLVVRVIRWARSPVPFKIPTTCGQQKSLPWVKHSPLEAPHNTWQVLGRMFLEIFFFRSLFRNTKMTLTDGPRLVYGSDKWLWLGGLAFHWSFFFVVMRHLRFFIEPVPTCIIWVQNLDGLMQVGVPVFYMTTVGLLGGVTYLFLRRVMIPQVKYISLAADYFPLFLIFSIALTGFLLRHTSFRVDIVLVKQLAMGLVGLSPHVPEGIGSLFYVHLFLVSVLLFYFPASKLVHLGGVFLSPTRNLANNSRQIRHTNPWNYDVKTHSYEEWEDEFREVMKEAGMPLDKEGK